MYNININYDIAFKKKYMGMILYIIYKNRYRVLYKLKMYTMPYYKKYTARDKGFSILK